MIVYDFTLKWSITNFLGKTNFKNPCNNIKNESGIHDLAYSSSIYSYVILIEGCWWHVALQTCSDV